MTRRLCFSLALVALASACTGAISNTSGGTESALMQSDRDFAVETHARGIEGWMSFFATSGIRIRYRGNMVLVIMDTGYPEPRRVAEGSSRSRCEKPRILSDTGLATGGPPVLQAQPVAPIGAGEKTRL